MTQVTVSPDTQTIALSSPDAQVSITNQNSTVSIDSDGEITVAVQENVSDVSVQGQDVTVQVSQANVQVVEIAQGLPGLDADELPPVDAEYSYNIDGTLAEIAFSNGTSMSFTYSEGLLTERVHVRENDTVTTTYAYTSGVLTTIDNAVS